MGNWAGDVMVVSAKEILAILDHMKELNTKLINDVGAYVHQVICEVRKFLCQFFDA